MYSPGLFQNGCYFLEYDPDTNTLTNTTTSLIPQPADCMPPSHDTSYDGMLMILPTGQIMFTAFNLYVEVYNPAPGNCHVDVQQLRACTKLPPCCCIVLPTPKLVSGSIE